ncbi:SCO7613 C-terminal domain-containing membrane protein [Modestobacter sp. URMC 112]
MTQRPTTGYPPPLDRPVPLPPAPPEAETGAGRVSPQSVLLGAGAVAVVAAGGASLIAGEAVGRGLVAVLACVVAAASVGAGRRELRTTEEVLSGSATVLAVTAALGPERDLQPAVLAVLAAVVLAVGRLSGLGREGPSAAAWPIGSWTTAQLAVLGLLGDLTPWRLPHVAAVAGTAAVGLLVAGVGRRTVALVALATAAAWWAAGVVEGLRLAWAVGPDAHGQRAGAAASVVAVAVALLAVRTRRLLQPLLGPRPAVPVLCGVVAAAAVAGALSSAGPVGVPATGYLGLGLAALVAATASPEPTSVLRPAGLTTASTLTVLAVGQLLDDRRWPALALLLLAAALPALLVAARQPVDRPGALPVAVGCLAGSALLADVGDVLGPGTAGTLLLGLAVGALVLATLLRRHRSESPLAATGAVVGLVALAVPGHWESASPQLAVLGVALTGYGTLAARNGARAAGCAALVGAAWLTAGGAEVAVPEAWTLPAAAGLLLYAGPRLADAPSWSSWGPGLLTAFGPSVALTVLEPDVRRVLLVVAAATVTTVLATRRQVQAPFVVGAGSLAVVAVGRLVEALPWSGLAAVVGAGALLLAVGARYESRRRQAANAVARVADMR